MRAEETGCVLSGLGFCRWAVRGLCVGCAWYGCVEAVSDASTKQSFTVVVPITMSGAKLAPGMNMSGKTGARLGLLVMSWGRRRT